ncbi:MAG: type II toxin-antitoxin system VapC family toxin [Acidobacteriia bacterium]|nr:type II toxin-antitoxin system VapC family toxin [Terriglobia bacterium]
MVVDTSAVLAILLAEREAGRFAQAIEDATVCRVSVASYLEAALVIDNRGDAVASREFDLFFRRAGMTIEPVTFEQAQIARQAYRDFGKGRHRAGLNFGDCLSYALAKSLDEPLLFKGADFAQTDIERAAGH